MNATIQEIEGIDDYWGPAFRSVYEGEGHEAFVQQLDERIVQHDKEIEKLCNFHYQLKTRRKRRSNEHRDRNDYHKEITNNCSACYEEGCTLSKQHSTVTNGHDKHRKLLLAHNSANHHSVKTRDSIEGSKESPNSLPKRRCIDRNRLGGYSNIFPSQGTTHSDSLSSHNLSLDLNESFTIDNKRDSSDYISSDKYTETIKYHTLHQQKSPELFSNKPETTEDDLRLVLHNHNQHSDILTPQNLIISVKGLSNTSAQSFDNSEKISVDQQDLRSYLETKLCDKSVDCKHTNGLVRDSQWFSAKTLKKHSLEIDAFDLDRQRESVDLDSGRGQYLYEKNQTSPVSPHDYGRQRHTQLPGQNDTELIQNAASENDSDQGASISNQLYREKRHDSGREWKRDESRHLSLEHLSDQCLLSMSQQHGKYEANNHYRDHSRYDTVETSSSLSHNFHEQQEAIRKFERCKRPRKRQYDTMINYRSCSSSTSSDHDRYQTHHSRNTRRNRHSPVVFDKGQKQGSSVSVVYEHQQRKQSQNEVDSIRRREDYRPGSDQDNYQRPCSSSERNRRQEKARLDSRQNRLAFKGQDKYRNTTSSHKRDEHHTEDDNRQRNVEVSEPIRPSRSSSFDFSSQFSGSRPKPKPTLNRKQRNIQISKREFSRGQGRYDSEAYSHHLATQVRPSSSERNRNLLDSTKTSRTRSIEPLNYKIRQNRPKSIENEILQEPPIPSAAKRVYSRKHTSRGSSPCELRPKIAETCTKQPVIEKKKYVIESDQISAKPFNTVSSNTAVKLSSKSKPGNHSLSNIGAKPSNNAGIKATMVDNNSIGRRVTSSQIFQSESLQFRQPSADQNNTENVKTSDREDYLATEKETTDKIQNNVDISKEGIESIADGQNNSLFTSLNTSDQVDLTRESPKNVIAHDSDDCQDSIETVILDFDQGTLKERKSTLPSLDDKSELNIRNEDAGTQSNTVYDSNKITEYNNNDCKSNLQNIILTTQAMDCSTNSEMSKLEHHSEIPFSPSKQDDISGKSSNASKNISEIKQEPIEHLINTASSTVSSNHCVEKAFFGNPYKQTGVVQSEVLSEENIFMLSVRDFDSVNSLLSADSNSEKDGSTFENNGVVGDIYKTIQVPAILDGFWYKPKKITFDNYPIQEKKYVANHRDPRLRLDISSSFKELNDQQEVFGDKSVKSYEYRCIYSDSIDNVDTKSHLDLLSESKGIIILPKAENESFKNAYSENLTISTDSSVESSCPKSPQFHENNNTQQEHFEERNAIPHFDPSNKQQNINDWINIVNKVAYACKWSDHQVVEYALPKLEGNTHTFFNDFSLNTSWKEYQKKLQTVYAPRANYAKLLCDMLSLKAMAGDSLIDYYVEKKKLLDKCSISGERAIDCVIFGIQDDSIRARLEAQAFFNLEDLSAYLHNL